MPPARSRANAAHDDSRSDASVGGGSRDKASITADKRRQTGGPALAQDKASATIATTNTNGTHAHEGIEGVSLDPLIFPVRPSVRPHLLTICTTDGLARHRS